MPIVSAGAAEEVDLATNNISVFGRSDTFDRLHLLDRFKAHDVDQVRRSKIGGGAAFRIASGVCAVHIEGNAIFPNAVHPDAIACITDSSSDSQQRGEIAASYRQFFHSRGFERIDLFG